MEREQALNRIISLAMKWQDPAHWRIMAQCESDWQRHREQATIDRSVSRDPSPFAAEMFLDSARQNQEAAEIHRSDLLTMRRELLELQSLVRSHAPTLLEMTVTSADVSGEIDGTQTDKLKRLEGAVRALSSQGGKTNAEDNPWKLARDQNKKITVSDQMLTLFKDDDSIVDRKSLSKEVAKILGCTDSAVRLADPAWDFYRTEQARRKKIRQELKGKRWVESDESDADD
jgi:hypothetical protein